MPEDRTQAASRSRRPTRGTRLRLPVGVLICLVAALGGGAATTQSSSIDLKSAFPSVPAKNHIAALRNASLENVPAQLAALPPDQRPAAGEVHVVGDGAYAWPSGADDGVCVLMASGSGGCLSEFREEPILLFLSGGTGMPNVAEGVVPDIVASVDLVTGDGQTVPAPIADSGFRVELPAGTTISGEQVTLTDGSSFFNADPVSGPSPP
jgi:hypothetical protein